MDIDVSLRELGAVDITALRDAILSQEEAAWHEDEYRQKTYHHHDQTKSIVLVFTDGKKWPDAEVRKQPGWDRLAHVAVPVMQEIIKKHYPTGGEVIRAMAAKLLAGGKIKAHTDVHQSFHCGHRIHVPITTNPRVWFTIDGRPYQFEVGQAYEINNQKQHSVTNKGDEDRITFIFDYVPPDTLARIHGKEKKRPESPNTKPSEATAGPPPDQPTGPKRRTHQLLGRESNYLLLHREFDVESIRSKIENFPDAKWLESEREQRFDAHRDTQALDLIHFFRDEYTKPNYRELYFELQNELRPAVDIIADYYRDNGFLVRMLFAQLPAGAKIPKHTDAGYALLNCHRVHIPIITNDKVVFMVGGEEKNMRAGEFWEINNELVHSVENQGDEDRIHLIIDWMPNHAGKSEEEVLATLG